MANLIKKIKIKKQDGTFTDYIPIGAEAQNVDVDGESVAYKLNKKPYYYNSVVDMKADTKLKVGDMVLTKYYSTVGDNGGAIYDIASTSSTYYETLSNGLYANLIISNGIQREKLPTTNYFQVYSTKLSGITKNSAKPINQEENKDSCIDVMYNECTIENINIANPNNYSDKTAIRILSPGQRQRLTSVFIQNGFKYGMKLPTAYYSEFIDVWVAGETGIEIGNPSSPSNWIGVLDFNACHFNACNLAIKEVATDTNTICFDKCSLENNVKCIENSGTMYFKNTYFGDTKTTTEDVSILDANDGSTTYFENCTIGLIAQNYEQAGNKISIFNLKSNTKGSKVFVNGGVLVISNNAITNSLSSIYDSDSNLNEIYLDNVKFVPSTANTNHNQFPYVLLEGYSPLRSLKPIKNYVINGTLKNPIMNDYIISSPADHMEFDSSLTNPFGGKVLTFTRTATEQAGYSYFYYKVPKHLVGKKMVLEIYAWCSNGYLAVRSDDLGVATSYYNFQIGTNSDRTKPRMIRIEVTPTTEIGAIWTFIHWNDPSTTTSSLIAGMVLKEYKYKDFLSCYEDQDIMITPTIPTNTNDAVKGDIVYSSPKSTNTGAGWIFNGTSWEVYNSYSS